MAFNNFHLKFWIGALSQRRTIICLNGYLQMIRAGCVFLTTPNSKVKCVKNIWWLESLQNKLQQLSCSVKTLEIKCLWTCGVLPENLLSPGSPSLSVALVGPDPAVWLMLQSLTAACAVSCKRSQCLYCCFLAILIVWKLAAGMEKEGLLKEEHREKIDKGRS